ncbi:MAG TPA: acyl-CoA thioesterase/bile acid-CoA:amino acid N-acyltransferase family protein [Gaiellaceae bacterium]|jgi:dienelactone hydrolase|nr:acyl-CoA thioesterase/bile acid-CoA:amino acid N-acyltransferase family protein [Gaiellaceae bacterium]
MRSRWVAASSTICSAFLLAGCGSSHPHAVAVTVTPRSSLEDQPVAIRVGGLRPKQGVYVTISSRDAKGVAFTARASFGADARGTLDLATAKPLAGSSYAGVWPMGLLTSMTAPNAPAHTLYWWGARPMRFRLSVASGGRTIAATTFSRRFANVRIAVRRLDVAHDGFDGQLYVPAGAHRRAAVLAFGGSEGGDDGTWLGGRFAAAGIPTLFVGYFHAPGLPDHLVNIPLEYFRRALQWLDRQPSVDPSRVSVYGVSYGTQAALLLGVHYPRLVHGVVALVPSDAVTCGILGAYRKGGCLGSAWTLDGKPLAHTSQYDEAHPTDVPDSVIPVEQIHAPVLLACGGRDQVWSSCGYADAIVQRRRAHGERTALYAYPTAGHFLGTLPWVYEPGWLGNDFYVPGDERGREALLPHVLAFLKRG